MPTFSYSQDRILTVMSSDRGIYNDFYSALKNNLHQDTTITKISYSDINSENLKDYNLIVSVGYVAAIAVSKHEIKTNIFYTLIPDNKSLQNKMRCKSAACYKIYINQPISRYVRLFKILFPEGKKLAFATTEDEANKIQQVKTSSKNNELPFKNISIQKNTNITRAFINNLKSNDVLLALPNPYIYNASNAKSILLSTYHANVPIIAYSKSFAKAGALISLYSSIENVAEMTAKIVDAVAASGLLKQKTYYPEKFMIEINSTVARSLNINIESENELKRKLK